MTELTGTTVTTFYVVCDRLWICPSVWQDKQEKNSIVGPIHISVVYCSDMSLQKFQVTRPKIPRREDSLSLQQSSGTPNFHLMGLKIKNGSQPFGMICHPKMNTWYAYLCEHQVNVFVMHSWQTSQAKGSQKTAKLVISWKCCKTAIKGGGLSNCIIFDNL